MAKYKDNGSSALKNHQSLKNEFLAKLFGWLKENFSTIILPLIAIVLLAFGIYFYSVSPGKTPSVATPSEQLSQPKVSTKETPATDAKNQTPESKEATPAIGGPETASVNIYTEKAARGEGITHLARKALKRYLASEGAGLTLTKEHKIYIEDYLKDRTGSYQLKLGQEVSFSVSLIKDAISNAQKLSQNQLNNLKKYSRLVPSL